MSETKRIETKRVGPPQARDDLAAERRKGGPLPEFIDATKDANDKKGSQDCMLHLSCRNTGGYLIPNNSSKTEACICTK